MTVYLDASALLRVLFDEPGERFRTEALHRRSSSTERVDHYGSDVLEVDASRAIDRLRLLGQIDDAECVRKSGELRAMLNALHMIPMNRSIVALASAPFGVGVRALDAIHVGSAQWIERELGSRVAFWTHDRRQAIAALSRGLTIRGVEI